MQVGRTAYTAWAREDFPRGRSTNMARATIYFIGAAFLWVAGGLDPDPMRRLLWWTAALAIEYAGPFTFFFVPGLGSTPQEWQISGAHMAERCGLFIIIVLGEGIIITGATFAELVPTGPTILARSTRSPFRSRSVCPSRNDRGGSRCMRVVTEAITMPPRSPGSR
jgi:low temperature requirement protein LtrA